MKKILFTFILTLCCCSAYADNATIDTPYFSLPSPDALQPVASDEMQVNHVLQHMYVYSANPQDGEMSLIINVIPAMNHKQISDDEQKRVISNMVHDMHEKIGNKALIPEHIETVLLKKRKYQSYTFNFQNGVIKIFTTKNNNNVYSFVLACYANNTTTLNKYMQKLTEQMTDIQYK